MAARDDIYAAAERAEGRHGRPVNPVLRSVQAWRNSRADPLLDEILRRPVVDVIPSQTVASEESRRGNGGHHVTTEQVVRAQFGGAFHSISGLRRRRSEIEYPRYPGDDISKEEAAQAIDHASNIVAAATELLPHLGTFRA